MIFGKIEFKIAEEKKKPNHFAWLPVLLADGRIAWLEKVCKEKWVFGDYSGNNYYERKDEAVWRVVA